MIADLNARKDDIKVTLKYAVSRFTLGTLENTYLRYKFGY